MNHALFVRRLDRLGDLAGDAHHLFDRHRSPLDVLRQRLPFHQLHHQEALAVDFFESVDAGDVGVRKRRQHPRLALEPRQPLRVLSKPVGQYLQRDVATELGVLGAPYLSHATFAQLGRHLVVRNITADHSRSS